MFSDAAVNMGDYGQPGMPKVVVLGGTDHKVYFNQNSSSQGINTAIDLALSESTNSIQSTINFDINTYPNPVRSTLNINYNLDQKSNLKFEVFNLLGAKVSSETKKLNQLSGIHTLNLNDLNNGSYLLKISTKEMQKVIKFSVAH